MKSRRIVSVIEEDWGKSIVYAEDSATNVPTERKRTIIDATTTEQFQNAQKEEYYRGASLETQPENEDDFFLELKFSLPYLQSSLFACVLEDTVTMLRILIACNTEMKISKTMADMPLLLAHKFRVEQPAVKDELDGIDSRNLGCAEYKLNKLDADRNFLLDVLLDLYIDLCISKSFQTLVEANDVIDEREENRRILVADELQNRGTRRELAKQLRQQRNHCKSVIYDTDVVIDALKTQVEDAALNAEIRTRYVVNWQNARHEQHIQTIADKEASPNDVIEYFKQRSDHEQRVHTEVELLVNIAINETLEKVEDWMTKYDTDMEAIDLKIQIKKNDYQNMNDKRVDLEQTIEKHDKAMKEWNQFKDEREKARQYHEKMTKSAIAVQAWWRGLLVRLQLGPFKVAKKKKGGPPSSAPAKKK